MSAPAVAATVEYVLPLRWPVDTDPAELDELTEYLTALAAVADVTVVDGSDPAVFARHATRWSPLVRHVPPDPWPGANGKVAGVVTGVFAARHETVVIADDDVRWTPEQLADVAARLSGGDVVRPQNYFDPLPWHARWDTARMLLNRAWHADYPGTFAIRRRTFVAMGGYDGDVLFENLQMLRTVRAAGGREVRAADLLVRRLPPTAGKFREQRVRQAYDDFAQPGRLLVELSWLPLLTVLAARRPGALPVAGAAAVAMAELGRRRHGGRRVFPATSALWAPVWVVERAVCVWLAALAWLRGGVRYRGRRLRHATRPVRPTVAARPDPVRADDPGPAPTPPPTGAPA